MTKDGEPQIPKTVFPLSWFDNPGPDEVSEERVKDDARIASRFGLRIN